MTNEPTYPHTREFEDDVERPRRRANDGLPTTLDPTLGFDPAALLEFLRHAWLAAGPGDELPPEDSPRGAVTREYFADNWHQTRELLRTSTTFELVPADEPCPRRFHFTALLPFKGRNDEGRIVLQPGPITGEIAYRADPFGPTLDPRQPSQAARIDTDLRLVHPNHCPRTGGICLGDVEPGPLPLRNFVEHLYGILSYVNHRAYHPLDLDAARYFATDTTALHGLSPVPPLY